MADKSQQTEKPTPRRIDRARREGRFPVSREAVSAFQFLAFAALVASFGAEYCSHAMGTARYLFKAAFTSDITTAEIMRLLRLVVRRDFTPLGIFGGILLLASLAAQLGSTRLGVSAKGLAPNFQRLNFLARLRELPRQNIPAFVQAVVLLPLFGMAVYGIVIDNWDVLLRMPLQGAQLGARQMGIAVQSLIWKAALAFLVLGAFDFVRQNRRYTADLRMSKQEMREEAKEMEGNPRIKGRIRQLRRDWFRRRMMAQVPQATAVIVNPTHYAVAIRYSMGSMAAPTVIAKGRNSLAQRIRKKAIEHQVPIIENPPLAQALYKTAEVGEEIPANLYRNPPLAQAPYKTAEVGQEIPANLYRAVAEILAYIYRIMGGRLP